MTRQEFIDLCLTLKNTVADRPFRDGANTVIRHKENKKWFALVFEPSPNSLCVNLKCDPMQGDFFRQMYKGVTPAWHMNKSHWNTVCINSDVPNEVLFEMVKDSYKLTIK